MSLFSKIVSYIQGVLLVIGVLLYCMLIGLIVYLVFVGLTGGWGTFWHNIQRARNAGDNPNANVPQVPIPATNAEGHLYFEEPAVIPVR